MNVSSLKRNDLLQEMQNETFDLLIIGGGVTGAGIALDAVTRGMKVALVEMHDFAFGTSSRSTKLVHGGLRYLKQLQVKEVATLGQERAIVYENGPHVTIPEWMLLPFHKSGTFGKVATSLGLKVYDRLARVKKDERRQMLSVQETLKKVPIIKRTGLLGSGIYVEYRTDDARLTIEILKTAAEKGAKIINYTKAKSFIFDQLGTISGVTIVDTLTDSLFDIYAKKTVNATGPWVDQLRSRDCSASQPDKHLKLTKGVHLVFSQETFPLQQAVYFDAPDGRMLFAIPRDGKTYVGTTDTFYNGDPAKLTITKKERHYIIQAIKFMFPTITVSEKDIESSWAGVRPLIYEAGKNPSEISRKDEIWESDSGLLTIAGGKLTGYRQMAEKVVDRIVKQFKKDKYKYFDRCCTKDIPISGGDFGGSKNFQSFLNTKKEEAIRLGLSSEQGFKLAHLYGTNVDTVFKYVTQNNSSLPDDLYAQLMYAIHYEMTLHPNDFFFRRTGMLLFDIATVVQWNEDVIEVMAQELNWSEVNKIKYKSELIQEINIATTSR